MASLDKRIQNSYKSSIALSSPRFRYHLNTAGMQKRVASCTPRAMAEYRITGDLALHACVVHYLLYNSPVDLPPEFFRVLKHRLLAKDLFALIVSIALPGCATDTHGNTLLADALVVFVGLLAAEYGDDFDVVLGWFDATFGPPARGATLVCRDYHDEREAQSCAQVLLAPEVSPPSPASKPVEFVADAGTAYPPTVLDVFNELKDDEAPGCEVDGETGGEAPGFQFDYKSDAATSVVFSNSGVEALPILGDLAVLSPLNTLVIATPTPTIPTTTTPPLNTRAPATPHPRFRLDFRRASAPSPPNSWHNTASPLALTSSSASSSATASQPPNLRSIASSPRKISDFRPNPVLRRAPPPAHLLMTSYDRTPMPRQLANPSQSSKNPHYIPDSSSIPPVSFHHHNATSNSTPPVNNYPSSSSKNRSYNPNSSSTPSISLHPHPNSPPVDIHRNYYSRMRSQPHTQPSPNVLKRRRYDDSIFDTPPEPYTKEFDPDYHRRIYSRKDDDKESD